MRQAFQVRLALAPVLALLAAATPCQAAELAAPVPEPAPAPVYRLTLTPAWTHAFVPRSVSRDALGLNVQFFFDARSRFGVGLVGALYAPFSRSEAPVVSSPLRNETRESVLAEFAWTFLRGRRAELSLLAGVGALSTRPLSVSILRIARSSTVRASRCLSAPWRVCT